MPSVSRRLFLASTLATLGTGAASAQNYPSRPLRIVVPFAAGAGVLDIMARLSASISVRPSGSRW